MTGPQWLCVALTTHSCLGLCLLLSFFFSAATTLLQLLQQAVYFHHPVGMYWFAIGLRRQPTTELGEEGRGNVNSVRGLSLPSLRIDPLSANSYSFFFLVLSCLPYSSSGFSLHQDIISMAAMLLVLRTYRQFLRSLLIQILRSFKWY